MENSLRSLSVTGCRKLGKKGLSREAGQNQLFILAVTPKRHGTSATYSVVNKSMRICENFICREIFTWRIRDNLGVSSVN